MKTYELTASEDCIIETLQKDSIHRNKDLFRFFEILNSIDFGCSIALDGDWGSGKTFFVKQAKAIFEANNPMYSGEDISCLKDLWEVFAVKKNIVLESSVAIYYDAWMNDNDVDPMLSIIYEILKQTGIKYKMESDVKYKEIFGCIASDIVNHFTGIEVKKYFDACKREEYLNEIKEDKELYKQIELFFKKILDGRGERLVLFIDELDRCRPDYAVRLLERVKHYFNNDRATYVFAINASELQHTIKRYYGEGFDATRYLDRFFDLRISMPKPNMRQYFDSIGFPNTSYTIYNVCENVIERYGFSLRETERYLRVVKMAVYNAIQNGKLSVADLPQEKGKVFLATYLTPILLAARVTDIDKYNRFISGEDGSLLFETIHEDVGKKFSHYMLGSGETFDTNVVEMRRINFKDRMQEIYGAVFAGDFTGGFYEKHVGNMSFSKKSKGELIDVVNLFSNLTILGDD